MPDRSATRSRGIRAAALAWALACGVRGVGGQTPAAAPESLGLSSQRLERLDRAVEEYVARKRIAGVVVFVARDGTTAHFRSFGRLDVERGVPMPRDAIFRVASMSKAVTSVGALMLMEEGRLLLEDPVARFLPSFAHTTVALPPPEGSAPGTPPRIVPARRAITIQDLLTHTSGISYGDGPARAQYQAAGIDSWYLADKNETIGQLVDRLAALPFDAQPGEKWIYGFSDDVLGRVIEVASGMSLDEFFRRRIFEPLHMPDTSFFLPPDKRARLATVYSATASGGIARAPEPGKGQGDYVNGPRKCFSGGAGLLSTAADYARFLQMLANGGELEGVRLLSPKTVELATANHVGSLFREGHMGFGLGFEITEDVGRGMELSSPGAYGWGSAYYATYWVDPHERLVAILLAQLVPPGNIDLKEKFRNLVYQALVGPPGPAR